MGIFARIAAVALAFLESIAHAALLPLLLQLLLVLLLLLLVLLHMVNPDDPPKNLSPIQVIYSTRDEAKMLSLQQINWNHTQKRPSRKG